MGPRGSLGRRGYEPLSGESWSRASLRNSKPASLPIRAQDKEFLSDFIARQQGTRRFGDLSVKAAANFRTSASRFQISPEGSTRTRQLMLGLGTGLVALRFLGGENPIPETGLMVAATLFLESARTREAAQGLEIRLRREDKPYLLPNAGQVGIGNFELRRDGEDLVLLNPTQKPIRVFQDGTWTALAPGRRRVLRHGEMFRFESESKAEAQAYRIRVGQDPDTFQLEVLENARVLELETQAPLGTWLPVFRLRGSGGDGLFRPIWKERMQILFSSGLDKVDLLRRAGERLEIDGLIREAHQSYEAAVDLAEKELAGMRPRNPDNRERAGEVYRSLGSSYFALAGFWDRRPDGRSLALENYEMAAKYLNSLGARTSRDQILVESTRQRRLRLHLAEAESWHSLGDFARAGENFEAAAELKPQEPASLANPVGFSVPSRAELLLKASRAFARSDPPLFEDFARVMQKIHDGE